MVEEAFLQIIRMTITASIVILIVLAVRLLLRRAPKVFSYALWAVVLFRLLCPLTIEAPISIVPEIGSKISNNIGGRVITDRKFSDGTNLSTSAISDTGSSGNKDSLMAADSGVGLSGSMDLSIAADSGVDSSHPGTDTVEKQSSKDMVFISDLSQIRIMELGVYLWVVGILALLLYSGYDYFRLRRKLVGASLLRENIYIADHILTAFEMGIFSPKIYLPSRLSEMERQYIIAHEQHHIHRLDHIWKLLSFAALCLHWFNPLVWAAFILSGRDMEMSCDEAILEKMGIEIRADYSASLLKLSAGRCMLTGTPLTFGGGNTKGRVINMANWKKPKRWVVIVSAILSVFVLVGCTFDSQGANGVTDSGDSSVCSDVDCTDASHQHDTVCTAVNCTDASHNHESICIEENCTDVSHNHDSICVDENCTDASHDHDSICAEENCTDASHDHSNICADVNCIDVSHNHDNICTDEVQHHEKNHSGHH